MKKLVFTLVVIAILLAACGGPTRHGVEVRAPKMYGGHIREECALNWDSMDVDPGDEGFIVNLILNTKHAPDSVGATLEDCINGGWTGWR